MDTDKITQELNQRFAAPLPEFYNRRIIFWYDEEREYAEKLDDIHLDNAKLIELTGRSTYTVKKLLCADDLTSNYLVYTTLTYDRPDDDWLINVELYSEEYRTDQISNWMEEMHMPDVQEVRNQVKYYRKFFNAGSRRAKVASFGKTPSTPLQVSMAVMAALCGNKDIQPGNIIQAVLCAGLENDDNSIYQSFETYGAKDAFWEITARATGYSEGDDSDLGMLAIHILLTATTRTMHPDNLAGLNGYFSLPHQSWCYDFVSDWLAGSDKDQLYDIARFVERKMQLYQRFSKLSVEDIVDTEVFPCVNECILSSIMTDISNQIIRVDTIRQIVEKRRTFAWYDNVSFYYEGILQTANMQQFYLDHAEGFHIVEPAKIWQKYTDDYYQMDTYYRLFQLSFQRSLKASNILLDDLFKQVADVVEGLYTNWFLGSLGENWSNACAEELEEYGHVLDVDQQTDFYREKVKSADSRVYVIISDAFRYEAAVSLADQLRREMQSKVTLKSREAIFPTATKFGMAALLPHKELSAEVRSNGQLAILADGQSTDAGNRDQVLKNTNAKSVALKYEDIIRMKRAERQALVRGMDVVYIYHNRVDEASHTDDSAVFPACDEAISEIKNLVRIIVNEFSGTQILITADHGFLYTYSLLKEDDKVDKTSSSSKDIEVERRYMITKKGADPKYLLPVKFLDGKTDFDAFTPRENVRIKKKGGGMNFVHGGISLQEMVVPVIEYHHLRTDSQGYKRNKDKIDTKPVELQLLSSGRKISNMVFSLNFYQKDPVGGNRSACNYLVYFTDESGKQVSDMQKIIADKISDNGQERTFRCSFSLRSQKFDSHAIYYLVIADESGLQLPEKIEFQIDIPFAVDDFNFFD